MKKITKSVLGILIIVFFTTLCWGQTGEYSIERAISLYRDSEPSVVEIEVQENTKYLGVEIVSTIESGKLTIEINDPKRDKQGNLSIGSMITASSRKSEMTPEKKRRDEDVVGRINKGFQNPMKGTWIIKFIPQEAECDIHVVTSCNF